MEKDNYLDINFSIRFGKISLADIKIIAPKFKNLKTEIFALKQSKLYNYIIEIKNDKDVNEFLNNNKYSFSHDIFISTYSEIDSYIFDLPSYVHRLISSTNCRVCISSTFLDPCDA